MNILIIINSLRPGGAERQVIQDANLFINRGYNVSIAFVHTGQLIELLDKRVTLLQLHSISVIRSSLQLFTLLSKHKFDIVFANMFWAQKVSALPSFLTGHKLVFFEHGLGLWHRWYHLLQMHLLSVFATRIVTVSRAKMDIKTNREKFHNKKIQIIPNSFTPAGNSISSKKDNGIFTICFAGRFNKVKQLHLLPLIAEILRTAKVKFTFVLMGEGQERENIKDLIQKKRLENYFELTGYIKNPQKIMMRADVFILPSKREDFSVALLEASSVGLPCLAFDVGGNREIIKDGNTGFIIPPFDIQVMAEKILYLIQDEHICKKMGTEAQKFVIENFSEKKRFERLDCLVKEII